jgi:hypothetical protein
MKLFIMQSSPTSCHFISLRPKYSPQHPDLMFSNTLTLCSSLNVRDQVSQPYRTTGKIIVLYILNFVQTNVISHYNTVVTNFSPARDAVVRAHLHYTVYHADRCG